MIPDVYITVASYDDLECEVSHVLYFMTTDCQTTIVKALLIVRLLKVQFTSQDITELTHVFYELRVICKYQNALVLYIPLTILYLSLKLKPAVLSLQSNFVG